ncbi:hypothetical protein BGW41_003265 [Actinomortierella wolfii]|nr:hypothetical protein BGW41_003265 [Actinomortierella wolfii]
MVESLHAAAHGSRNGYPEGGDEDGREEEEEEREVLEDRRRSMGSSMRQRDLNMQQQQRHVPTPSADNADLEAAASRSRSELDHCGDDAVMVTIDLHHGEEDDLQSHPHDPQSLPEREGEEHHHSNQHRYNRRHQERQRQECEIPTVASPSSISPLDPSAAVGDGVDDYMADEESQNDSNDTMRRDVYLTPATITASTSTPARSPPAPHPFKQQPSTFQSNCKHQRKRWAHYLYQTRIVKNPLTNTEIEGDPTFFAVLEPNQGGWWYEPWAMASFATMPSKAAERGKEAVKAAEAAVIAAGKREENETIAPGGLHGRCMHRHKRAESVISKAHESTSAPAAAINTTADRQHDQQPHVQESRSLPAELTPEQKLLEKEARRERWRQSRIATLEEEALHELDWRRWQRSLVAMQQKQLHQLSTQPNDVDTPAQGSERRQCAPLQPRPTIPLSSESSSEDETTQHHHHAPSPEHYRRGIRLQLAKDLVVLDPSEHGLRLPTRPLVNSSAVPQSSAIQATARVDPGEFESISIHVGDPRCDDMTNIMQQEGLEDKAAMAAMNLNNQTYQHSAHLPYHDDQAAFDAANLAWWDPSPQPFKMPNPKLSPYAISTLPEPVARAFGGKSIYAPHSTAPSDNSTKPSDTRTAAGDTGETSSTDTSVMGQSDVTSSTDASGQQQKPQKVASVSEKEHSHQQSANTEGCTWVPVPPEDRVAVMIGTSQDFLLFPAFQRLLFRHLSKEDYEDKAGRRTNSHGHVSYLTSSLSTTSPIEDADEKGHGCGSVCTLPPSAAENLWEGEKLQYVDVYDGTPGYQREDYDTSDYSYGSSSDYSSLDEKDEDFDCNDSDTIGSESESEDDEDEESDSDDSDESDEGDGRRWQRRQRRNNRRRRQWRCWLQGVRHLRRGSSQCFRWLRWPFRRSTPSNSTTLVTPATPQRHRRTGFEAGPDQEDERARIRQLLQRQQQQLGIVHSTEDHASAGESRVGSMSSFFVLMGHDRPTFTHWEGIARLIRFYLTVGFALVIMAAIVYGAVRAESTGSTTRKAIQHPGNTEGPLNNVKGTIRTIELTREEIDALQAARRKAMWPPRIMNPTDPFGDGRPGNLFDPLLVSESTEKNVQPDGLPPLNAKQQKHQTCLKVATAANSAPVLEVSSEQEKKYT